MLIYYLIKCNSKHHHLFPIFLILHLVACGGKSGTQQTAQQNAILGRWEIKEGKDSSWFYERFELFSDGTSVTSAGYQEKWISENGR